MLEDLALKVIFVEVAGRELVVGDRGRRSRGLDKSLNAESEVLEVVGLRSFADFLFGFAGLDDVVDE